MPQWKQETSEFLPLFGCKDHETVVSCRCSPSTNPLIDWLLSNSICSQKTRLMKQISLRGSLSDSPIYKDIVIICGTIYNIIWFGIYIWLCIYIYICMYIILYMYVYYIILDYIILYYIKYVCISSPHINVNIQYKWSLWIQVPWFGGLITFSASILDP